jgi:hypothetical protein
VTAYGAVGSRVSNQLRRRLAVPGMVTSRMVLGCGMTNTPKPASPPLFTPSTLPQPAAVDPVVAFIEDALLTIANRQDEPQPPAPSE